MMNTEEYEKIQIERERSDYPRGLRHKRKDTILENSLFDLELIKYKVIGIAKGQGNGKRNNTGRKAESESTPQEIL